MKSINIYLVTRILNNEAFNEMLKSETNNKEFVKIKNDEQLVLIELVNLINSRNDLSKDIFDGFYLDFKIPHIGKEFDLLKASCDKNNILNIELKSQNVDLKKIEEQLYKNKYYLSAVFSKIEQYTYVQGGKIYKYKDEKMLETSIEDLVKVMSQDKYKTYINSDFNELFRAKDYLISPINDIDRFIANKYFLTNEQYEKKNKIIELFNKKETILVVLSGKAGTGKTLLAYDIAVELSKTSKVLILFCGNLTVGHITLNEKLNNVDIDAIKNIGNICMNYDYVIIDEVQRIKDISWRNILEMINRKNIPMMLTGDEEQFLSYREKKSGHFVKTINSYLEKDKRILFKLNNRIRTNPEMASFLENLLDYSKKKNKVYTYDKVTICYANDESETKTLISYFQKMNYIFINFTGARQGDPYYDSFRCLEDMNSHRAVGQEFDNVVIALNKNFQYVEKDSQFVLQTTCFHPTGDYYYRKMLFQALTRARERIAIIVVGDLELFKKINSIKISE